MAEHDADISQITPAENDVFSYLIDENTHDIPLSLNADARLMIVAGR